VSVDFSKKITEEQLQDVIFAALGSGGFVRYSSHFKDMMDERGYTNQDVNYILRFGKLVTAEFKAEYGDWCYEIRGVTPDGEKGALLTVVLSERKILMITALGGV
jgi:hypothetical protein